MELLEEENLQLKEELKRANDELRQLREENLELKTMVKDP